MLTQTKNASDGRISNLRTSPHEFQELVDDPVITTDRREPLKSNSFYSDLHDTASMYHDLWDELSSYAPNFNSVAKKSTQIRDNIQLIKRQYNYFSCESPCNELKHIYNAFCQNVLYEDTKTSSENSKEATSASSNEKNRTEHCYPSNELNCQDAHNHDQALISQIITPLSASNSSWKFNSKEDFREFLTQTKLPRRTLRRKLQVLTTLFSPFFFLIVLVFFVLGRNYQSSYDLLNSQLQQNRLMFDIHSQVNNIFESKYNIMDTPFHSLMKNITNSAHQVRSLIPSSNLRPQNSKITPNLMVSPGLFKTFPMEDATKIMLEKVNSFSTLTEDQVSIKEDNYLFWSHNMQNEYYIAQHNQTRQALLDFKNYASDTPFNAVMGIIFFILALVVLFLNYLGILSLFGLSEDTLHLFLTLTQPELNLLKQNCQIFLDYLRQCNTEVNDTDDDHDLKPIKEITARSNLDPSTKTRIRALKHYMKSRTPLENWFVGLMGLLIVLTFLLFLIPIPFQTESRNNLNLALKDLSNLVEFENLFSFSYNSLKQQLILETPILNSDDSLQQLKLINNQLSQFGKNLTQIQNHDFIQEIQNKIEILANLTNEYDSDEKEVIHLLKEFESQNLDQFRRVHLREFLSDLRDVYPQKLESIFRQSSVNVMKFESFVIISWIVAVIILYSQVLSPLFRLINERKKLVCLIPFKFLMKMGMDLTEYIETYYQLPSIQT